MRDSTRKWHLDNYGKSLTKLLRTHDYCIRVGELLRESEILTEDIYLCPLCLKHFFYLKNNEFYANAEFTSDHFPPKSVGGKQTILVCVRCNSSYGIDLDYSLKEYLSFKRFISRKDKSPYPMKVSYNGVPGKYNQNLYWENGSLIKEIDFKKYPLIKEWLFDLKNVSQGFSFKITAPSEKVIQKALLRSAYLLCFANWGYDFAYSPTGKHIRNVLENRESHPLSNYGVFGDYDFAKSPHGFYFNDTIIEQQAFFVFFTVKLDNPEYEEKILVVIPGPDTDSWNQLFNFKSWIQKKQANFELIELFSDSVKQKNYFGYSSTWLKLTKKQ
jgi:hypothetical protein